MHSHRYLGNCLLTSSDGDLDTLFDGPDPAPDAHGWTPINPPDPPGHGAEESEVDYGSLDPTPKKTKKKQKPARPSMMELTTGDAGLRLGLRCRIISQAGFRLIYRRARTNMDPITVADNGLESSWMHSTSPNKPTTRSSEWESNEEKRNRAMLFISDSMNALGTEMMFV